jgi:hypothetical protein
LHNSGLPAEAEESELTGRNRYRLGVFSTYGHHSIGILASQPTRFNPIEMGRLMRELRSPLPTYRRTAKFRVIVIYGRKNDEVLDFAQNTVATGE